ncbi:hypothetical protein AgCh_014586 [Apium graveolens]
MGKTVADAAQQTTKVIEVAKPIASSIAETIISTDPVLIAAGAAGGIWSYSKHRQRTNVHITTLNLVKAFF